MIEFHIVWLIVIVVVVGVGCFCCGCACGYAGVISNLIQGKVDMSNVVKLRPDDAA